MHIFNPHDRIEVTDGPLNMRNLPGADQDIVASLATGTQMCVVDVGDIVDVPVTRDGYDWYQVDANGTTGWVAGEFCALVEAGGCANEPPPASYTHQVTGTALNLRSTPSASGSLIGTMPIGERLNVLEGPVSADGYSWYRVDPENYAAGWCVNGFDPI